MKKNLLLFVTIGCLIGCGQDAQHSVCNNIKTITVNAPDNASVLDLSDLFDTENMQIIPLETEASCLVTAQGPTVIAEDYILIADDISQKISMFDMSGKFMKAFGRQGAGPGEYTRLGSFILRSDSIYVKDEFADKIIVYPVNGDDFREMQLNPKIFCKALSYIPGCKYLDLITGYGSSDDHYVDLIRINWENGERQYLIPYDKNINENGLGWSINQYTSVYQDTTLMIESRNDTIYNISENGVYPQYVLNFTSNRIPADLMHETGGNIIMRAIEENYNLGLDIIFNAPNHIMGYYSIGQDIFMMMYNKTTGEVKQGKQVVINDWGGIPVGNMTTNADGDVVIAFDAMLLKQLWDHNIKNQSFEIAELKEKLTKIMETIKDDNNPILIKTRFKNVR